MDKEKELQDELMRAAQKMQRRLKLRGVFMMVLAGDEDSFVAPVHHIVWWPKHSPVQLDKALRWASESYSKQPDIEDDDSGTAH